MSKEQLRVDIGRIVDVYTYDIQKLEGMDRITRANKMIDDIIQAFADEIEAAELRVIKNEGWPYEHAVAFTLLRKELGMCLHEDYAYNGGKCSKCGKVFPGEWI